MNILLAGSDYFSVATAQALLNSNYQPQYLLTYPDRRTGRNNTLISSPLKTWGVKNNYPNEKILTLKNINSEESIKKLQALELDILLVVSYGRLLKKEVLNLPHYPSLNIHPSLLPKYRGPSPMTTALLEGESQTGVSLMIMTSRLDTGPLIGQKSTKIENKETRPHLSNRLAQMGAELFIQKLPLWVQGKIKPQEQKGTPTYTSIINKKDGKIDWQKEAPQIERMTRALQPWPGVWTYWQEQDKLFKILNAFNTDRKHKKQPGQIVKFNNHIGVACGQNSILGLEKIQLAGKNPMSIKKFINGYPQFIKGNLG